MRWLYQPLLLLIARSTDGEMASQVEFLKAQNPMLRRRVKRVQLEEAEKRLLVKRGLGAAARAPLSVVAYSTYRRHANRYAPQVARPRLQRGPAKGGRPRTPQHVRDLVVRLARETDWGYTPSVSAPLIERAVQT